MRHFTLLISALLLIGLTACREEGVSVTTITGEVPDAPVVEVDFAAITSPDRTNDAAADLSVSGLNGTVAFNPDGSLDIPAGMLDPNGTRVTVTKPGHWPEHRLILPAGNGNVQRETFELEPKVKAGAIDPAAGGRIDLGENFSVALPPNTIVTTADGAAYDGEVEVYVNHDAPEDANEMLNSASNFLGLNADGTQAVLESYGMMDIALEAPDGTPLVLDGSTPAEVRMPLQNATPETPETVPFWVLDPDGFWLPNGTATLAPGCYVVFITSSSTCNIDVPHPVTRICGRFVDPNGLPLTHSPFLVSLDGGMSCSAARVDCDGYFCVNVAAGVPLLFNVTDPCTEEVYVFAVDPVDPNTSRDIGEITVDLTTPVFLATVRDCGGMALPDLASTEIWAGGNGGNDGFYFAPDETGATVINLVDCSGDDLVLQAFTKDYKAASRVIRKAADDDTPVEFIVCGDVAADEYFTMTIGGVDVPVTELAPVYWPDNGEFDWLVRAAGELDGETYSLFFRFADPRQGDYNGNEASAAIYRLQPGQDYGEGRVYVDPAQNLSFKGVSLSEDGTVFEGTFSVPMNLQNEVAQTVEAVGVEVTVSFRLLL